MGRRDFVFKKLLTCLKANYEVPTQLMEKPGDEVHFLKRRMVLQHDFRFAIQTHHKHVQQMCTLLELQGKKTPGHCDMDQCDRPGPRAALNSPVEGFKISARRTLANMSDINGDEGSPNFIRSNAPTSLADSQLACNFIKALQHGAGFNTGFSANVDMVANALGRGETYPPASSEEFLDEHVEAEAEVTKR